MWVGAITLPSRCPVPRPPPAHAQAASTGIGAMASVEAIVEAVKAELDARPVAT